MKIEWEVKCNTTCVWSAKGCKQNRLMWTRSYITYGCAPVSSYICFPVITLIIVPFQLCYIILLVTKRWEQYTLYCCLTNDAFVVLNGSWLGTTGNLPDRLWKNNRFIYPDFMVKKWWLQNGNTTKNSTCRRYCIGLTILSIYVWCLNLVHQGRSAKKDWSLWNVGGWQESLQIMAIKGNQWIHLKITGRS